MDHYTPCLSRPTEVHARRRKNVDCQSNSRHEAVLHHFSSFLSHQESRVSQLMRNFDIDTEDCDRIGITDPDTSNIFSQCSNSTQSSSTSMPLPLSENTRPKHPSAPRPGRLSPTTMQMVLSSNISTASGISSAADTSYDSGLYQWLGVRRGPCDPVSSSGAPIFYTEPSEVNGTNIDISLMTSLSAYSQPSLESRMVLPLSPPATACPPFSETLGVKQTGESKPSFPDPPSPHQLLTSIEPPQKYDLRDFALLDDFASPILSKNLSLQHYMPSASILRHFQRVIDELRELYAPNDAGNNAPITDGTYPIMSTRLSRLSRLSPPISNAESPSRTSTHLLSRNPSISAIQVQSTDARPVPPINNQTPWYSTSSTTRELYTEMAVMLFTQVANEEAQITNLRSLVDRLEILAGRKRKIALVIGTWGLDRY